MFVPKWLRVRGVIRGEPAEPEGRGRRWGLRGLILAAVLLQTGCQSGPFSPCGFFGRATSRLMSPFRGGNVCCGPEIVSDVPMEVVTPGAVVVPAPPAVPVTPVPSTVVPPETPSNLEPLPRSQPGPAPTGSIRRSPSSGSTNPSSYESSRSPSGSSRSRRNLAHSLVSTPVPTGGTAQESRDPAPRDSAVADSASILDNLPPLELPGEVTEQGQSPPVPPAAEREPSGSLPAAERSSANARREGGLALASSSPEAPDPAAVAEGAPGIARFVSVDLKLAGGSRPSPEGVQWLAEKGYKTLLDLSPPAQISPALIAEAGRCGLRYLALPVNLETLDRTQAERFSAELALDDARPLYFFDEDGTRAGALWYLRRITVERFNAQLARREAEELGLVDPQAWQACLTFLNRREATASPSPPSPPAGPTSAGPGPVSGAPTDLGRLVELPQPPAPTDPLRKRPLPSMAADELRDSPRQRAEAPGPFLPSASVVGSAGTLAAATVVPFPTSPYPSGSVIAWNSIAPLLLALFSFPLAYLSRSVAPSILAKTRANLPAPARQPRSLPLESGA